MRIKMGTVVTKMGTFVHVIDKPIDYRNAIAMALHEELGSTSRAIKRANGGPAALISSRWRGIPMRCCSCFSRLRAAMWWWTKAIEGQKPGATA